MERHATVATMPRVTNWRRALGAVAAVFALAFLLAPSVFQSVMHGTALPWRALAISFLPVLVVPVTIFMVGVWWSERAGSRPILRLSVAYVATAVVGALSYVALDLPARVLAPGEVRRSDPATAGFLGAYNSLLVVGLWALVHVIPAAARTAREQEREREELRRAAEQARLRATLEPHFVLNTLNAIAGLVHEDPDQARERIGDLGDLLRDVVRLSDTALHPLDDEIRWLERYTRILVARHAGRLEVSWDIDPASRDASVPVLVLQPLVENAIQHGALQRADGGRIAIATRASAGRWSCTIADNGPGFAAAQRSDAQGLALTRRRLAAEWPGATLQVATGTDGTRVEIAWQRGAA